MNMPTTIGAVMQINVTFTSGAITMPAGKFGTWVWVRRPPRSVRLVSRGAQAIAIE